MTVRQIYQQFFIPPNLQNHMVTVAKISSIIANHWQNNNDFVISDLIKVALLHDLGNIVKFDFDKFPQFLGTEISNIQFWKDKQTEIIQKYGKDDHEVTKAMLNELKTDQRLIDIILAKSFDNSITINNSNDWLTKILRYSDLRVMPNGIGSLQQRLDEIKNRITKYQNNPELPKLIQACFDNENKIQAKVDFDLKTINQDLINSDKFDYLNIEI